MHGDDGDPIRPWLTSGIRRIHRWQRGHIAHHACRHVTVGTMPDGRWWVEHTAPNVGARAYPSEARAREVAAAMTSGDGWREVPAEYDVNGQPTQPGWVRRGGSWYRP